jgi:hypothetical protein
MSGVISAAVNPSRDLRASRRFRLLSDLSGFGEKELEFMGEND